MTSELNYILIGTFIVWIALKMYKTKRNLKLLPLLRQKNAPFIDVRSKEEFSSSHAPNTINMPLAQIQQHIDKWDKNAPIVLFCATGTRSAMAQSILKKHGFKEIYNMGSWRNIK